MKLDRVLKFLARQKFRFDTGAGYLSVCTFAIVASKALSDLFGGKAIVKFLLCVPLAMVGAWLVGYISQRLRFTRHMNDVCNEENEVMRKLKEKQ